MKQQIDTFENCVTIQDIYKIYKMGKTLGRGTYGTVNIVNKRQYKYKKFAMKRIHRDRIKSEI